MQHIILPYFSKMRSGTSTRDMALDIGSEYVEVLSSASIVSELSRYSDEYTCNYFVAFMKALLKETRATQEFMLDFFDKIADGHIRGLFFLQIQHVEGQLPDEALLDSLFQYAAIRMQERKLKPLLADVDPGAGAAAAAATVDAAVDETQLDGDVVFERLSNGVNRYLTRRAIEELEAAVVTEPNNSVKHGQLLAQLLIKEHLSMPLVIDWFATHAKAATQQASYFVQQQLQQLGIVEAQKAIMTASALVGAKTEALECASALLDSHLPSETKKGEPKAEAEEPTDYRFLLPLIRQFQLLIQQQLPVGSLEELSNHWRTFVENVIDAELMAYEPHDHDSALFKTVEEKLAFLHQKNEIALPAMTPKTVADRAAARSAAANATVAAGSAAGVAPPGAGAGVAAAATPEVPAASAAPAIH